MNKTGIKVGGIALGASLLAAAGYALYKYFSQRSGAVVGNATKTGGATYAGNLFTGYMGNSLVKSNGLYESSALTRGAYVTNH